MKTKVITFVLVLCAVGITAGCIPVPLLPSGDIYSYEDYLEDLVKISATKREVIEKLGNPRIYRKTSMSYKACGKTAGIGFIICLPYQCGGDDLRSSECFKLVLEFDDEKHLLSYLKLPWPHGGIDSAEEDMMILKLADQGDTLARSIWEQSGTYMRIISEEREAEWRLNKAVGTYCPNADLGHADAQKHIGDLYYLGIYEIKRDLISAYVWYSLAVNGGDKGAAEQLDQLINELSTQQLNEAQIQLEKWEPGQCERDLMKAITEENE